MAILKVEGRSYERIGQGCSGGVTEFDKEQAGGRASKWGPPGFSNEATSESIQPALVARAVDGGGECVHGIQLQGSAVVRAEADGIDVGEH